MDAPQKKKEIEAELKQAQVSKARNERARTNSSIAPSPQ